MPMVRVQVRPQAWFGPPTTARSAGPPPARTGAAASEPLGPISAAALSLVAAREAAASHRTAARDGPVDARRRGAHDRTEPAPSPPPPQTTSSTAGGLPETAHLPPVDAERTQRNMEEAIQYADDPRASNAGTQDLLGTHDTMMRRTAETATGKTEAKRRRGPVSASPSRRARQIVESVAMHDGAKDNAQLSAFQGSGLAKNLAAMEQGFRSKLTTAEAKAVLPYFDVDGPEISMEPSS